MDEFFAEVLPEDKARFVEEEKAKGRRVMMIGDGINDSPALSAADVGIAISDGAEIAREIADVTVGAEDLWQLVALKHIGNGLMKRIHKNYRTIVGFNTGLIVSGCSRNPAADHLRTASQYIHTCDKLKQHEALT